MFNSSSFKYLFNFPCYIYCVGICSTCLFVCMYVKTNLLQVLVIVNIEAIRVVKDVSDVQPSQKGHLHRHLKAKLLKGVSFLKGFQTVTRGKAWTSAISLAVVQDRPGAPWTISLQCSWSWSIPILANTQKPNAQCSV